MADRFTYDGQSTGIPWPGNGEMEGFGDQYARHIQTLYNASALPLTAVAGSADNVEATVDPELDQGLVDGMKFTITWAATNNGPVQLKIGNEPWHAVLKANGDAFDSAEIVAGRRDLLEFIGGDYRVLSGGAGAGGGGSGGFPVGHIAFFARNSAPSGWLKANGAEVSRTSYSDLFALVGTMFGFGDGATTFNLPDLRGEFVRGWDDGRGADLGRTLGSAQADEFRSHSHELFRPGTGETGNGLSSGIGRPQSFQTGAAGGNETRPRNIALLGCIKY